MLSTSASIAQWLRTRVLGAYVCIRAPSQPHQRVQPATSPGKRQTSKKGSIISSCAHGLSAHSWSWLGLAAEGRCAVQTGILGSRGGRDQGCQGNVRAPCCNLQRAIRCSVNARFWARFRNVPDNCRGFRKVPVQMLRSSGRFRCIC